MTNPASPPTTSHTRTRRPPGNLACRVRRAARVVSQCLISAVFTVLLAANPGIAFAADTDPINTVIDNIRLTIMAVIAGYATLCMTIGLLRITSGEPGEVERGKAAIRSAIIGYIGAALSPAIVTIIAGWVA